MATREPAPDSLGPEAVARIAVIVRGALERIERERAARALKTKRAARGRG